MSSAVVIDWRAAIRAIADACRADPALARELTAALGLGHASDEVTVAEFARRRGLGVSTVRGAIRDGRVTARRTGRAVRVAADAQIAPRQRAADRLERRLGLVSGGRS